MENGILYVAFNESIRNPEANERLYKIGITKNSVFDRYYGLGLKMPGKLELLFAYKLDEYKKAENIIHGILSNYRENGEWFNISDKQLELIKANCEEMKGILITDEFEKGIGLEISPEENVSKNIFSIRRENLIEQKSHDQNVLVDYSDKCMFIKINDEHPSLYERVRRCWNASLDRAKRTEFVLAVIQGKIKGVFQPTQWYYAIDKDGCPKTECDKWPCKRIAFIGIEANNEIQNKYLDKRVSEKIKNAQNPIQYGNM